MGSSATDLILKERVPDILRHSRDSQNVILTLLVPLGADASAEHDAVIPDSPESARGELELPWVGLDRDHLPGQLRPWFALVATLECSVIVLQTQQCQPCHDGI